MGDKEYKPRHVLVETENEAKAIIARLQNGTPFEEVAKESRDPGSRERGGDLGWSNPGMYVQPFSEAMVKLEKGKYTSTPVKSDFGYHVIQLDDVRDVQAPPFEEVKAQLEQRLQQQKVERHVLELREKAKVE
jgi:peptidyl-prolyl cis-trans isomerase C